MWSGKKPKLSHLTIFGSIMHVKTLEALRKLEDRRKEMVFVGYERGTKGYRCFDLPHTRFIWVKMSSSTKDAIENSCNDNRVKLWSCVFQVQILDLKIQVWGWKKVEKFLKVSFKIWIQMKKQVKVKGWHQQAMKWCQDFDMSKLSTKRLIWLRRSDSYNLKNLPLIPRPLKKNHGGKLCFRRLPPLRRMIHGC